ncbi:biotin--[acetyl-CoA-carboxylase] ligase [Sphingoaurantiacus capsulatus]|uniref:biotin--[biotin carboxyl-carrier protein] ligase n=1 Tax=Sphingoaurantiacus capsulatus TaxID=1771310 RepID=A0ABV7XDN2_9SPHN
MRAGDIVEIEVVGSTNDWMAERAAAGAPDGLWVRADRQTGGRGRRGRAWTSEAGNLFASALCRPQPGEGPAQQLSFVAALALDEALQTWVPAARLGLKWPNDVLLDGVKCCGILLEGVEGSTIVGIGVNLLHHPGDTERPATSLMASGIHPPSAAEFAIRLRDSFAAARAEWRDGGFAAVRERWMSRAAGKGRELVARLGQESITGTFEDLGFDGALRLRLPDGSVRAIHAGEVFGL